MIQTLLNVIRANYAEETSCGFRTDISKFFSEHVPYIFTFLGKILWHLSKVSFTPKESASLYDESNISVFQLSIVHADKQMLSSFPVWKFAPFSGPLLIWMCIQAK